MYLTCPCHPLYFSWRNFSSHWEMGEPMPCAELQLNHFHCCCLLLETPWSLHWVAVGVPSLYLETVVVGYLLLQSFVLNNNKERKRVTKSEENIELYHIFAKISKHLLMWKLSNWCRSGYVHLCVQEYVPVCLCLSKCFSAWTRKTKYVFLVVHKPVEDCLFCLGALPSWAGVGARINFGLSSKFSSSVPAPAMPDPVVARGMFATWAFIFCCCCGCCCCGGGCCCCCCCCCICCCCCCECCNCCGGDDCCTGKDMAAMDPAAGEFVTTAAAPPDPRPVRYKY